MEILDIDEKNNNVIVKYNDKDTLTAKLIGFTCNEGKLYCIVKLPDWCCNGSNMAIYAKDFVIKHKTEENRLQHQLAITELEKVKVNLKDRISMMNNEEHSYLQKVVSWYDICEQVNKQIKEFEGE